MFFLSKKKKEIPLDIDGIPVRPSMRARRMALRVDHKTGDVVLVWPRRGSETAARRFVTQHRDWIENQRKEIKPQQVFAAGQKIFIFGVECEITPATGRGVTRIEDNKILVHGRAEHLPRRVKDFLKAEALRILKRLSDEKAAILDLKPVPIRVIDPKTRWGSCSADGRLMYSWRLILAPPEVLDYVVAHEVAHRIHMNHGRSFWKLCASLTKNAALSRRWLRNEGRGLMVWR
jgi:predicted metal-dependent hydrolase